MKNLALKIMLIAIGAAFSINVFAVINAATMEKQRKANTAALKKSSQFKRHFDKAGSSTEGPAIKLNAIPASPRRGAKATPEQAPPASPGRAAPAAQGQAPTLLK